MHADHAWFIERWSGLDGGQERANYALFLSELCDVIGVSRPDPAHARHALNDYVFERRVEKVLPGGEVETGRIDLYKRGSFILEAKQSRKRQRASRGAAAAQGDLFEDAAPDTPSVRGLDAVMINARRQAERYAGFLPADHDYPPFIIACDVGRAIELYADFSGHGRHYAQFPDARSYRIELSELYDEAVRNRLREVWERPAGLDPALRSAAVTREIAGALASLSKALETRGFAERGVALFLMRCLFTMFVEDIGLLKKNGFTAILARCLNERAHFVREIGDLWRRMDVGDYSPALGEQVLRFNGKLFKQAEPLALTKDEIALLHDASLADWRDLEPAIFGTLFEQALDPVERRRLGAHYTPRAYVEIVVDATIMEPLGQDWAAAQVEAFEGMRGENAALAKAAIREFLGRLSSVRVCDPACGTGNFLYVALRRMKQLEGEAVALLKEIGGDDASPLPTVCPAQFFGIERNPRAVEIAELVLWIGSIQWHMRTHGTAPAEPIVGDADHVFARDALLTWDGYPQAALKRDAMGRAVADGTGREIPLYPNAALPLWPEVDFIVGNPPFVGGKDIRERLGQTYAEALFRSNPDVAPSADLVMHWWDRAAGMLARKGTRLRRFGFVTTNSITQVFQRRVVERHLSGASPISLVMAIPDHPWTKASPAAAAVRIAMTVAEAGVREGVLRSVVSEEGLDTDEPRIAFESRRGRINADLTVGADVTATNALVANRSICSPGVKLHGDGFIVTRAQAIELGLGRRPGLDRHIREYRNGRDLTARSRDVLVIDLFGLSVDEVRQRFPEVYQHVAATVREQRAATVEKSPTRDSLEYLSRWWVFGKPRQDLRNALSGLTRYVATVETAKHRVFQFLDASVMPDNMIVAIAVEDAFTLGVLSSSAHKQWALSAGGSLEDRPRYTKSRCFDPFPFPDPTSKMRKEIGEIATRIDEARKDILAEHPDLTLTTIYNAVAAAKTGPAKGERGRDLERRCRALILKEDHEKLDRLVTDAYGWPADLPNEAVVERLVALNAQRRDEERRGVFRWLRGDYQMDALGPLSHRADRVQSFSALAGLRERGRLPDTERERASEILGTLEREIVPVTVETIASAYEADAAAVEPLRRTAGALVALGSVSALEDGRLVRAAS